MCQAKPLPRCSSHAPGLVRAAKYKYQSAKTEMESLNERIVKLENVAREKGLPLNSLEQANIPLARKILRTRARIIEQKKLLDNRLRDVWEAELHFDATKEGLSALTVVKDKTVHQEYRHKNALSLRSWHRLLRSKKGENQVSIFAKEGDPWLRKAVLDDELRHASSNYENYESQFQSISDRGKGISANLKEAQSKPGVSRNGVENMKGELERLKKRQIELHYLMILERTKKNLIADSADYAQKPHNSPPEDIEKASDRILV